MLSSCFAGGGIRVAVLCGGQENTITVTTATVTTTLTATLDSNAPGSV